ncbi:MAG: glycosyltransferase family 9 protein [Betaproteobacteria bacterium]|nr:glycosyltransferase family 9 protein [Betaproteobacteria bacterium]
MAEHERAVRPELRVAPQDVRSILVINVSRIGDTLLVTPALRAIAAAFPGAAITCLAHPKRAEVLEHLPFVARVGRIDKRRAPFLGWLPGKAYDLAFVFGFDRPLVAYALRVARRVVAFRQGDPALDRRLAVDVAEPPAMSRHAVFMRLALLEPLGIAPAGLALAWRVTAEEAAWARATLARELPEGVAEGVAAGLGRRGSGAEGSGGETGGGAPGEAGAVAAAAAHPGTPAHGQEAAASAGPLIGLQVASFPTKAYRDWPIEHFQALCERILARWPNAHFLIFGGSLERRRTAALARRFDGHATLFAGRLTLRQTAALMDRTDLYVGVDTGPTHIMGALHRPMVALYHCHSPARLLAPLEHPCCRAIDHPRAGEGCGPQTPMAEIAVDTVWHAVEEALESGGQSAGPRQATAGAAPDGADQRRASRGISRP